MPSTHSVSEDPGSSPHSSWGTKKQKNRKKTYLLPQPQEYHLTLLGGLSPTLEVLHPENEVSSPDAVCTKDCFQIAFLKKICGNNEDLHTRKALKSIWPTQP